MNFLEILALTSAALVGMVLFGLSALFANMVATGGLYGRGSYADATALTLLGGALLLVFGVLPLAFVGTFAWTKIKRGRVPGWLKVTGWTVVAAGVGLALWDVLTSFHSLVASPAGAAMTVFYLGGLAAFLVMQKRPY